MWRNKIKDDSVIALKSGDKRLVEALRYLVSILDKRELQLPLGGLTEAEEIAVLRKELKNKQEAKEMFAKAQREDLVAQEDYEIGVIKKYLPPEMEEAEIVKIVEAVVAEKGKIFGAVMGETMKKVAGRANGDIVAKVVKELIGK